MTPDNNTVAYPGREGAHSAAACARLFPAARLVAQASFHDVVEAVTERACTYGVLPIESSLVGPVNETHDLLYDSALSIVAEAILPIRHCLVGPAEVPLEDRCARPVQEAARLDSLGDRGRCGDDRRRRSRRRGAGRPLGRRDRECS